MSTMVGVVADSYNAPAVGGWVPTDLGATLQLWLDASDTGTITSSGGAVSQWNDKSALSRNYVQTVAGNKPMTGTRTINSKNVIDFDGTDDYLLPAAGWTSAQPISIVAVVQLDVFDAVARIFTIAASTRYVGLNITGSGTWAMNAATLLESATVPNSTPHVVVYIINGVTSSIRLDGTGIATGVAGAATLTTTQAIGASTSGISPINGGLGEMIITNTVLSGTDLTSLEGYLKTKWGTP